MTHRQAQDAPENRIVYIRSVAADELPGDAQTQQAQGEVYAIHRADGARVALVAGRDLAFALARRNDMAPVSAH